jgi:hypothetical protein
MDVLIATLKPIHQTEPTDRQLKLSPQWTSRIVNGWANASEGFMEACSQALDMPIGELFGRHGF